MVKKSILSCKFGLLTKQSNARPVFETSIRIFPGVTNDGNKITNFGRLVAVSESNEFES